MLYLPPHIKPFDGNNYDEWALAMRALLEAHSAWGIIVAATISWYGSDQDDAWRLGDEKGAGIILCNCAPAIQRELISAQEDFQPWSPGDPVRILHSLSKYRWDYLKRVYKDEVDARPILAPFNRHEELYSYKFVNPSITPLNRQFAKLEELRDSLKGTQFELSANAFVALVLHALPQSYFNVVGGYIASVGRGGSLDYERVKSLAFEEEVRQK
ncbi:hypothetical protein AX16_001505 [Volvariella volvacea WC 439]|nr:hypothetical protein AX16_001505 [Volvariella volvacea WC 439]